MPTRLPRTRCIEENPPSGAAAVLLNQSHNESDLVLPIDAEQRKLWEAIDGKRTIAEILDRFALPGDRSHRSHRFRSFFQRLWSYDQVVFDMSQHKGYSHG